MRTFHPKGYSQLKIVCVAPDPFYRDNALPTQTRDLQTGTRLFDRRDQHLLLLVSYDLV